MCGLFYNKRFSIICFHCQIVRNDEFPDSKFYTLKAGSYLISEHTRENNKKNSPKRKPAVFSCLCPFLAARSSNAHVSSMAWPYSKSPALDLWRSHILLSSAWSFWSTMNSPIGQLYYWPCPRSPLAASLHQFPWVLCSSLPHLCLQVYHPPLLACQHPGSCLQPG